MEDFLSTMKTDRSVFDFNQLVPCPDRFRKDSERFDAGKEPTEKRSAQSLFAAQDLGGRE